MSGMGDQGFPAIFRIFQIFLIFFIFSMNFGIFPIQKWILHPLEPGKPAQRPPRTILFSLFFREFYKITKLEVICL